MSNANNARLPEIGEYVRMHGRLMEVQDVTPPVVPQVDYIFEDTTARVEMRVNGKVVKDFGSFNNFYGEGTCVKHAVKEAQSQAGFYGEAGGVEFVVVKVTSRCRKRPVSAENYYAPEFRQFETLKCGYAMDLPEDVEEMVWSSKAKGEVSA